MIKTCTLKFLRVLYTSRFCQNPNSTTTELTIVFVGFNIIIPIATLPFIQHTIFRINGIYRPPWVNITIFFGPINFLDNNFFLSKSFYRKFLKTKFFDQLDFNQFFFTMRFLSKYLLQRSSFGLKSRN